MLLAHVSLSLFDIGPALVRGGSQCFSLSNCDLLFDRVLARIEYRTT